MLFSIKFQLVQNCDYYTKKSKYILASLTTSDQYPSFVLKSCNEINRHGKFSNNKNLIDKYRFERQTKVDIFLFI